MVGVFVSGTRDYINGVQKKRAGMDGKETVSLLQSKISLRVSIPVDFYKADIMTYALLLCDFPIVKVVLGTFTQYRATIKS